MVTFDEKALNDLVMKKVQRTSKDYAENILKKLRESKASNIAPPRSKNNG